MRISYNPEQLFDATGVPLSAGRVSLFVHDSDVPLHVYSLSGTVYSDAENPIILDSEGRMDTVWFAAAIVDIKVEKNVDGVYESVDTYQYGFNPPEVKNDTYVTGMDALADANPDLGTVTVVGYYTEDDCPPRTYVWDPTCTDDEDGGCIVASAHFSEGRWLLYSDLEYLPSCYYGIKPGVNEANLAAFISYPALLGQWRIPTPPVPRFLPGTYTSTGSMSTPKRLAFDRGAKFTALSLGCFSVEVQPNTDYVCDFTQLIDQDVAHSSWFRNAEKFWACSARELHQDTYNYFESNEIRASHTILNARISGQAMTLAGTGRLMMINCSVADHALSTDWYTSFTDMCFTDRWFTGSTWDFSANGQGHHIQLPMATNSVDVSNFDNANVYVLAAAANNLAAIDMQHRTVSEISADMPFYTIVNLRASIAHFTHDVNLEGCAISNLYLEDQLVNLVATDCTLGIADATAKQLVLRDCRVAMNCDLDTLHTGVNALGGTLDLTNGSLLRGDATSHYASYTVALRDIVVQGGEIQGSGMSLRECDFYDTVVRNVPSGVPGNYGLSLRVDGCNFGGSAYLAITPGVDDENNGDVYEVNVNYVQITGNTFQTSVPGLRMPFWAQDMEHRFIAGTTTYVAGGSIGTPWGQDFFPVPYIYADNYGNCPKQFGLPSPSDSPTTRAVVENWTSGGSGSSEMFFMGNSPLVSVFALPAAMNANQDAVPDPTYTNSVYHVDPLCVTIPYHGKGIVTMDANTGGTCIDFPIMGYLPCCAMDKTQPNDMFYGVVGSWSIYAQLCGVNPIAPGQ